MLVASLLWLAPGCDKRTPPPIIDPDSAPIVAALELEVEVSVEPQEGDPQEADVWVSTSHPALWKKLPRNPASPEWEGLVVVREKEAAEALPLDQTTGTPASPGLKGDYSIVEGRLRFRLAEPLRAGAAYRVEFHRSLIPGFDIPGAPPTLPVLLWHVVPEPKAAPAQ
jgi:hypothetical protein